MKIIKEENPFIQFEELKVGDVFSIGNNSIFYMRTDIDFNMRLDNGVLICDNAFSSEERKWVIRYNNCTIIIK